MVGMARELCLEEAKRSGYKGVVGILNVSALKDFDWAVRHLIDVENCIYGFIESSVPFTQNIAPVSKRPQTDRSLKYLTG